MGQTELRRGVGVGFVSKAIEAVGLKTTKKGKEKEKQKISFYRSSAMFCFVLFFFVCCLFAPRNRSTLFYSGQLATFFFKNEFLSLFSPQSTHNALRRLEMAACL